MVDTALHLRPSFYTFFQSNSPKGGDALTYYDYQRALRAKRVEILQQKKATAYEPGYKKPGVLHPASRKIFQLKSKFPALDKDTRFNTMEPANEQIYKSAPMESVNSDSTTNIDILEPSKTNISASRPSSATGGKASMADLNAVPTQAQTERLPSILTKKPRLVKSATARDNLASSSKSSVSPLPLPQRPKTVASVRDCAVQTAQSDQENGKTAFKVDYIYNKVLNAWHNLKLVGTLY